jgi:hypothetical protein
MISVIALIIGTPAGAHLLSFSSERAAAQGAEAILRQMPRDVVPAPVWISCRDKSVAQRLSMYLEDVQDEVTAVEFDA